jgi:glycosyltransferase involved in cell wall biosynthesis
VNVCLIPEKYPPDPGGLAVSARRLARGLAAQGHCVHVCLASEALPARTVEHTQEDGLAVHRVGAGRRSDDTLADWFDAVVALHGASAFDVLHAYYAVRAGYVCVYAARYLGRPSVVSARGNDLDRTVFDPSKAGAILWTLAHADAVTAVSSDLARRVAALGRAGPLQVIPNGVDATAFAPRPKDVLLATRLGLAADRPTVGFIGEARVKKGLGPLLLAFEHVTTTQPAQLVLVGGVRDEDAAMLRVFQHQHPDLPLLLVPPIDHDSLPDCYNLLDVLTLPSLHDGLPNALLEGMACARPVVASAAGGIPDAVTHGRDGLLVPPGDVDALTAALLDLLRTPDERARLGAAARQTVCARFSLEMEVAQNLELYRRLSGEAPNAPSAA